MVVATEDGWYAVRRERWRPGKVTLLLIAESVPAAPEADRRFFYDDTLTSRDGLFREVIRTIYPGAHLESGDRGKTPWLGRLRADGVFLIDLADSPVNDLPASQRAQVLRSAVPSAVIRASALQPLGVALIKKNVFELLRAPALEVGLPILHDEYLPFPASGQQVRFREGFGQAVQRLEARIGRSVSQPRSIG